MTSMVKWSVGLRWRGRSLRRPLSGTSELGSSSYMGSYESDQLLHGVEYMIWSCILNTFIPMVPMDYQLRRYDDASRPAC
jgi:hypothetical protein